MDFSKIAERGLVLLGCGKMGGAMLQGWLAGGLPPGAVWVMDPKPSDWLTAQGVNLNADLPPDPAVVILAVKPQMMADALPVLTPLGNGRTLFVTIAAGTAMALYEQVLGQATPVIRAMPNTPAAIGKGVTGLVANAHADADMLALAETLLSAVGQTVRVDSEDQLDILTAVSGSGPAYVFHLIEAMAQAGEAEGLPSEVAQKLALATVSGAGQLAEASEDSPTQLRINVTSPGGTTAEALKVLMDDGAGFVPLMRRAVQANIARSKELAKA